MGIKPRKVDGCKYMGIKLLNVDGCIFWCILGAEVKSS